MEAATGDSWGAVPHHGAFQQENDLMDVQGEVVAPVEETSSLLDLPQCNDFYDEFFFVRPCYPQY